MCQMLHQAWETQPNQTASLPRRSIGLPLSGYQHPSAGSGWGRNAKELHSRCPPAINSHGFASEAWSPALTQVDRGWHVNRGHPQLDPNFPAWHSFLPHCCPISLAHATSHFGVMLLPEIGKMFY